MVGFPLVPCKPTPKRLQTRKERPIHAHFSVLHVLAPQLCAPVWPVRANLVNFHFASVHRGCMFPAICLESVALPLKKSNVPSIPEAGTSVQAEDETEKKDRSLDKLALAHAMSASQSRSDRLPVLKCLMGACQKMSLFYLVSLFATFARRSQK